MTKMFIIKNFPPRVELVEGLVQGKTFIVGAQESYIIGSDAFYYESHAHSQIKKVATAMLKERTTNMKTPSSDMGISMG